MNELSAVLSHVLEPSVLYGNRFHDVTSDLSFVYCALVTLYRFKFIDSIAFYDFKSCDRLISECILVAHTWCFLKSFYPDVLRNKINYQKSS